MNDSMHCHVMHSPLGALTLVARGEALVGVYFEEHRPAPRLRDPWIARDSAILDAAAAQLRDYFLGTRTRFELRLDPLGTPFQQRVWAALTTIAHGETSSYRQLAARVGTAGASRAVGAANARNPLSIVVPCHRVVGADGTLTGYAGGLARKAWLLAHERGDAYRTSPGGAHQTPSVNIAPSIS